MKHAIYALADPNTHEVRYVGQTSRTLAKRLYDHMTAARRNVRTPLYDWIRRLSPERPVIVLLQTVHNEKVADSRGKYESTAITAETKWMKRFERSQLLTPIARDSRAYRKLVNPA